MISIDDIHIEPCYKDGFSMDAEWSEDMEELFYDGIVLSYKNPPNERLAGPVMQIVGDYDNWTEGEETYKALVLTAGDEWAPPMDGTNTEGRTARAALLRALAYMMNPTDLEATMYAEY